MTHINSKSLKSAWRQRLMTTSLSLGIALFGLSSLALVTPGQVKADPIPIADLARFESMTNVVLSPDGKHIAAIVSVAGQKWPVISIWDANDLSKPPVWIPSEKTRITNVSFFGNGKIFFIFEQEITNRDGRGDFTRKLFVSDLEGKETFEPFKLTGTKNKEAREAIDRVISVSIFNQNLYNPDLVLLTRPNPSTFNTEYFEFNKKTGATKLVAADSEKFGYVSQGVDLATGEPLIRQGVKVLEESKYYLVTEVKNRTTGAWERHPLLGYKLEERTDLAILGFDTDPNVIFVRTNRGRNFTAVFSYDLRTRTYSEEPLFANDQYDIQGIGFKQDYENKRLDYISSVTVNGPSPIQLILDEKWGPIQAAVKAAFPGKNVYMSINRASDKAIVTVEAMDFPTEYYLYANGKLAGMGGQRPWLKPSDMGKGEFVTYKARDGLEIPAIVTLPTGWTPDKGAVPTVVHPHGGPWARDDMGWGDSGWVQFMASRGIAVIQPQYRGSDGWGDKLWKAGDGEWGQKMQDDKDDAAAYMVSRGIADKNKIAIFGYSYGGFAAIAASVRPNSPYRCAIAGAGVSSLERLGNLWGDSPIQREVQGQTVDGMDPLKNVGKASIPPMMYHGNRDRQADYDHSVMFYNAMKAAGNDVEFTTIKDMWHTLPWRPEWHTQTLTLIENYLKSPKCGLLK